MGKLNSPSMYNSKYGNVAYGVCIKLSFCIISMEDLVAIVFLLYFAFCCYLCWFYPFRDLGFGRSELTTRNFSIFSCQMRKITRNLQKVF
jgi:hypothetical protein